MHLKQRTNFQFIRGMKAYDTRLIQFHHQSRWFWRERSQGFKVIFDAKFSRFFPGDFGGNAHRGTRWHSMQSFDGPFHTKITWDRTGLMEGCDRRKCFYCSFIEMECLFLRFSTYVIGSSLAEIVKIENTGISNQNDADRGSDCEVRRTGKTHHPD